MSRFQYCNLVMEQGKSLLHLHVNAIIQHLLIRYVKVQNSKEKPISQGNDTNILKCYNSYSFLCISGFHHILWFRYQQLLIVR